MQSDISTPHQKYDEATASLRKENTNCLNQILALQEFMARRLLNPIFPFSSGKEHFSYSVSELKQVMATRRIDCEKLARNGNQYAANFIKLIDSTFLLLEAV